MIIANDIKYYRDNREQDWFYEKLTEKTSGSEVICSIDKKSDCQLVDVFKAYQNEETLDFVKTDILIQLSQCGSERYISRSQAKRILRNLEKFEVITLDFAGVQTVGQGFVDEVFRVFQTQHPDIQINYIHANENVTFMIERAL